MQGTEDHHAGLRLKNQTKVTGRKPICWRGDNIKMESKGIRREVVDWIYLAQGSFKWPVLVNM